MYDCIPGEKIVKKKDVTSVTEFLHRYMSPETIHQLDGSQRDRVSTLIRAVHKEIDKIPMIFLDYKLDMAKYIPVVLRDQNVGEREIVYRTILHERDGIVYDNVFLIKAFLRLLKWRTTTTTNTTALASTI
jgi:hypothetical protein